MTFKVLIDNNIWAIHEKEYPDVVKYIAGILEDDADTEIYMTRIIQMELLAFSEVETKPIVKENREGYIKLADFMLEVDETTVLRAAEIRRKSKLDGHTPPKGPDALIAAAASLHNLTVVTNNEPDFAWASSKYGFKVENPIKSKTHYTDFNKKYEEDKKKGLI